MKLAKKRGLWSSCRGPAGGGVRSSSHQHQGAARARGDATVNGFWRETDVRYGQGLSLDEGVSSCSGAGHALRMQRLKDCCRRESRVEGSWIRLTG